MPYTHFPVRADDVRDAATLCSSTAKDSSSDPRVVALLSELVGTTADNFLLSLEALAVAEGSVRDASQSFEASEQACRLELRMLGLATRARLGAEGEEELRKLRNGHSVSDLRSGAAAERVHAYRDHATRMQARTGINLPSERLNSYVSAVEDLEATFAALGDADREAGHRRDTMQQDRALFLEAYRRAVRAIVAVLGITDASRVLPSFYRGRPGAEEGSSARSAEAQAQPESSGDTMSEAISGADSSVASGASSGDSEGAEAHP